MSDLSIRLDDKYTRIGGRVFMTGTQALVRLPMLQRLRDAAAGLNTAGFVSGYRGSPLGGVDLGLWQAKEHLARHHVVFQPGVNEDLAATAVWGSQQVNLFPGAKYDGVFGMWYGKGPGVDRCGDVFRHANAAGTSPHGGVLVVAGDDHNAKSSTLPHQTEHLFKALMMPVLYPSGVQEYLDYGLHGWAMSRYSGCWVAMKALADTVETSASVRVDPLALRIRLPDDVELPEGGLNIRWPDDRHEQERRLLHFKLYAALAYCRSNQLNRVVIDSPNPRLGIITAGKSYLDVRQAFDELGIDERLAAEIGIRLYKVGMVWPLEAEGVRHFAEGLEEILVVEEKRQLLEYQLKEELYNWREDVRPRVIGKFDEKGEWACPHGDWLLPAAGELSVAHIARVIAERVGRYFTSAEIKARLALIEAKQQGARQQPALALRTPTFCSGCPHNTSTRVPQGSRAVAGIGCHYMVTWMNRQTSTYTHMGGEGVPWVGQAPFTEEKHIFANLGDGTYFHSGVLAIRQAVAAKVPITYKILYNDAVAMTGGQPVDGVLSVARITRQLEAEGVLCQVIVTDEPEKYAEVTDLARPGGKPIAIHHRDELDQVQRALREYPGVSVLIYDQTCATEKRRRRKRGKLVDPARRVFINAEVCEGCGDCGEQSNCLSILPLETGLGRKRSIDQSACNKDFSCLKGYCPSFVTIEGGQLRQRQGRDLDEVAFAALPDPPLPQTARPYNILVTGVGGTGVITLGAMIGMAAHIDGKGVSVLDMTGLAQKYGAVYSHLRIADQPEAIHAARIATGEADAVLGGDLIVSASAEAIAKMQAGRTRVVINAAETPTAEFTHNPDWAFPQAAMQAQIGAASGPAPCFFDANELALQLLGDALFANLILLGAAWQRGMIPVSAAAIDQAIELNGMAVARNRLAFVWGRRMVVDEPAVRRLAGLDAANTANSPNTPTPASPSLATSGPPALTALQQLIEARSAALTAYQDAAYAARYRDLLAGLAASPAGSDLGLQDAAARSYYKLLAIKDEFEVARLFTDGHFERQLAEQFAGDYRINFHLAPPLLARRDPQSGHPQKQVYGPWMLTALRWLARCKGVRGSWLDPFRWTAERRFEQSLLQQFEADVALVRERAQSADLSETHLAAARELLALPLEVRGFGHVKQQAAARMAPRRTALRAALTPDP